MIKKIGKTEMIIKKKPISDNGDIKKVNGEIIKNFTPEQREKYNKLNGELLVKYILSHNPKSLGGYYNTCKPSYIENAYVIDTICKDEPLFIKVWRENQHYCFNVYFKNKEYKSLYCGYCLNNLIKKIITKGEPTKSKYISKHSLCYSCNSMIKEYKELLNEARHTHTFNEKLERIKSSEEYALAIKTIEDSNNATDVPSYDIEIPTPSRNEYFNFISEIMNETNLEIEKKRIKDTIDNKGVYALDNDSIVIRYINDFISYAKNSKFYSDHRNYLTQLAKIVGFYAHFERYYYDLVAEAVSKIISTGNDRAILNFSSDYGRQIILTKKMLDKYTIDFLSDYIYIICDEAGESYNIFLQEISSELIEDGLLDKDDCCDTFESNPNYNEELKSNNYFPILNNEDAENNILLLKLNDNTTIPLSHNILGMIYHNTNLSIYDGNGDYSNFNYNAIEYYNDYILNGHENNRKEFYNYLYLLIGVCKEKKKIIEIIIHSDYQETFEKNGNKIILQ